MRNGSFSREKRPGSGVDHKPPSSVKAKERPPPPNLRACMACNKVKCNVFINYALFSSITLLQPRYLASASNSGPSYEYVYMSFGDLALFPEIRKNVVKWITCLFRMRPGFKLGEETGYTAPNA